MKISFTTGVLCCAAVLPFGAFAATVSTPEAAVGLLTDHRPKEFTTTWFADVDGAALTLKLAGAYELPATDKQPAKLKINGTMQARRDGMSASVPFSLVALGGMGKLWVGEPAGSSALSAMYFGVEHSYVYHQSDLTRGDLLHVLEVFAGMPVTADGWMESTSTHLPGARVLQLASTAGHKLKFDLTADGFLQFARAYGETAGMTFQTEITRRTQPVYVSKPKAEGEWTSCLACSIGILSTHATEGVPVADPVSSWTLPDEAVMTWVPSTEYAQPAKTFMPARGTIEYNNLIRARRNETRWQDVERILNAVAAYAADKGRLPSEIPTDGNMEICPSWDFCYGGANLEVLADGYLNTVPMDPLLKDRTGYLISQQADGSVTVTAPLAELKEQIYVTRKLPTTNESNRTFLKFAPDQRSSHMQRYEELLQMRQAQDGAVQMNFATKLPGIRVERPSRRMMQEEKKSDGIVRTLWFSTGGQMWRVDE